MGTKTDTDAEVNKSDNKYYIVVALIVGVAYIAVTWIEGNNYKACLEAQKTNAAVACKIPN